MKHFFSFLIISTCSLFIFSGCGNTNKIEMGDVISITYTAYFSNGEIFDENSPKTPLLFEVGAQQVIQGLDEGVVGLKVGKKNKKINITPDKGYGALYSENLVQKVGKLIFDKIGIEPEIGTLQALDTVEGVIRGIETDDAGNEYVLFDINPRQTRDTLTYKITILAKQD